ncbi:hypothetical protein SAMN06265795_12639 [Noviherbaspirillum humi]|uniref:Uncharacterized protein n=1 Tax=Noviherbaspirillum humi TaxID=1688639 RepID=A0A239LUN5_9BURK|nr:hypothetical protein [Noviherbaspirillum humi]SNT33672.1 hypothetical protein SAMN06265795_12639 [Noviherbaspirillum humi]
MPRGGKRDGAGRKVGSANTKTREIADRAASEGLTPLEFMLQVMRNDALPENASPAQQAAQLAMRFEAAKAAAPYIHPRLSSVEANIKGDFSYTNLTDDELDAAITQAAAEAGVDVGATGESPAESGPKAV